MEISVSSHIIREQALEKKLKSSNVIYEIKTLFPNSSEMHLAEHQNDVSDLLPTQGNNVSSGKVTNNSANIQKNGTESGGVDGFVSDAMAIGIEDVISFPKEIRDEDTISKEQNGSKRRDGIKVKVGLSGNDLYIQYKSGRSSKNKSLWATIKIPNATNYSAGQIIYRLGYLGTYTDIERLAGDAVLELFNKNGLRLHKGGGKEVSSREAAMRDALVDVLRGAGVDVVTDVEEGQSALDRVNGESKMQAKKRALATVSVTSKEAHQPTVVSSADGAEVLKKLDETREKYDNISNRINTFVGDIANALGATRHNSKSEYATFETKNGRIVIIRLADHNATVSNFDMRSELDGISIVVSPKKSAGITNDGDAHVVEYYYDAIKLRRAEGKPLADIVRSIKQVLYSGEFKDTTGLAERQEVNADDTRQQKVSIIKSSDAVTYDDNGNVIPLSERFNEGNPDIRFFRTPDGDAYGFTVGGKIYIDPRIATSETPIHEYAHLWSSALRSVNPEEWNNVVGLMKGTPLWDEVKRNYPELGTDDDIADEVIAQYSGKRGAEMLRSAESEILENGNDALSVSSALDAINKVKESLKRFWKGVADFLGLHFTTAEEVADKVMADMLNGVNPASVAMDGGLRYGSNSEEAGIVSRAKADGTYMKAPNGKPSNLTPRQWEQVRTQAFKKWFGDWEKAARIETLRKSESASITGKEIELTGDYKQNKKNALEYGKKLQGEYTNADTGVSVQLQCGRKNGGINEVLQHNYKDDAHILSVAAIPQIIEKSIYIDREPNKDTAKNPDIVEYQHFVCGLKIGGEDYTVHSLVAVDKHGDRYYDHNLTHIEKTKLLDSIKRQAVNVQGFDTTSGTEPTTLNGYKGKKLLEVLQTNSSKVVDENGEPLVVYHGTDNSFTVFDSEKSDEEHTSFYFTDNSRMASSYTSSGKVMEAFLNLRELYVIEGDNKNWDNLEVDMLKNSNNPQEWMENILKLLKIRVEKAKRGHRDLLFGTFVKPSKSVMESDIKLAESQLSVKLARRYKEVSESKPNGIIERIKRYFTLRSILREAANMMKNRWMKEQSVEYGVLTREIDLALNDRGGIIFRNIYDYGSSTRIKDKTPGNVFVAYNRSDIKSATDNIGTFDGTNPDIRYQFVGERGAAEMDKAEEATVRLDNLSVAREMEAAGKDAKAVKLATGWERGTDSKWRYEIMDGRLKDGWEKKASRVQGAALSDVLDNEGLFSAYPALKNVCVSLEGITNGIYGKYRPSSNTIALSDKVVIGMDAVLAHEVQHAIQHIEGFAKGGSKEKVRYLFDRAKSEWKVRS